MTGRPSKGSETARPSARKQSRPKSRSRSLRSILLRGIGGLVGAILIATILPIGLLRFVPPLSSAFMLRSHFKDPATGRACREIAYDWTAWDEISPHVPRAILVAEDQRFLQHHGFDTKAIADALDDYVAGEPMRGASTLTQQVAKNLFLWPGRSLVRKGLEAWLTIWIELLWPKQRIVEVHVNVAQFGPCLFGVEAASHSFFGKPAANLSELEAARLAAVLPAPGRMRAGDPGPFVKQRAREILAEMKRGGGPSYLRGL